MDLNRQLSISKDHILNIGKKRPTLTLFHGAIGRAYNQLYEPILPYKDELMGVLNNLNLTFLLHPDRCFAAASHRQLSSPLYTKNTK